MKDRRPEESSNVTRPAGDGLSPGKKSRTDSLQTVSAGAPVQCLPVQCSPRTHEDPFALHLIAEPVQMRGAGAEADVDVPATAARGVADAGGSLPFADKIQASFGEHDVSHVRAHVGGAATEASHAIGATAYATGHHIAFAGSPDLHTAAHEAAHVVQQRGGVQLAGGVGAAGDRYEQHANAVADLVVRGESAESLLSPFAGATDAGTSSPVQRFGADEHEYLGNMGSGARSVMLAPGYWVSFGEMVALAGDHFSSIEQMRTFAAREDGGPGSRLEIEYARKWKLGKDVPWKDGDPKYEAAKKAQEKRYYVLAGGNEEPYKGNASHFPNPREGDEERSTAEKATDFEKRWDDRTDGKQRGSFIKMWAGVGAISSYRINHVQALYEAWQAGTDKKPVGEALARDAFACHYLTDSFSGGHIRTPRLGAKQYWDAKAPMFYENLTGYMAEKITEHLVKAEADLEVEMPIEMPFFDTPIRSPGSFWFYPDADHVPKDKVWSGARDKVRKVFESKSKISLGDVVAGAMHDFDNGTGVKAHVDGKQATLFGDGQILKDGRVNARGAETAGFAIEAVSLSVKDILRAYEMGEAGADLAQVTPSLFGADELFAAERLVPTLTADDRSDASNPELEWKFDSSEQLITNPRMRVALQVMLSEKANELTDAGFKGDEQAAIESLANAMKGDPTTLLRSVINWTPNAGPGIDGSADANARSYFDTAKKIPGGVASLTTQQRINLAVDCINGTITESDEATVWGLLESASDEQARGVIKHIGWDDLDGYLDGAERTQFRKRFPADGYR